VPAHLIFSHGDVCREASCVDDRVLRWRLDVLGELSMTGASGTGSGANGGWESILHGDPKRNAYVWAAVLLGVVAAVCTFAAMQQGQFEPMMIAPLMALVAAGSIAVGGIRNARAMDSESLNRRAIKKFRIYFIVGAVVTAYYVFMYFRLR
jgi:hypothetical protein